MVLLGAASGARLIDLWTWPGWTALGVLFAGLATIAAFLAWRQGKSSQRIADERYMRDIQPLPRLTETQPGTGTNERYALVVNAGGPAVCSCLLVSYEDSVWAGGGSLPNSPQPIRVVLRQRTPPVEGTRTKSVLMLMAARDVQGTWWDCIRHVRIEDLETWWTASLDSLGIPKIALEDACRALTPGWPS